MTTTSRPARLFAPTLAVALTVGAAAPLAAQRPAGFDDAWRALVAEQRETLEARGVVGATLAFVHDGEIVAGEYYGMEDLASNRPVDEHTIYHWASITKTFTAVGVMQLRDRGMLELDDPIVAYVPEQRCTTPSARWTMSPSAIS